MVHLMIEEMLHNHAPNHGVRIARCRLERHIAGHIVCGAFRHGTDNFVVHFRPCDALRGETRIQLFVQRNLWRRPMQPRRPDRVADQKNESASGGSIQNTRTGP